MIYIIAVMILFLVFAIVLLTILLVGKWYVNKNKEVIQRNLDNDFNDYDTFK